MSGKERDYTPGTPGMVYTRLDDDDKYVYELDRTYDYGSPPAGEQPHRTAEQTAPMLLSVYIEITEQLAAGSTLSAEDQQLYDDAQKGCWLLDDTADAAEGGGWAYWSIALQPDTATNLLLDEVKLINEAENDWLYRIDVKLQAVSLIDVQKWDFPDPATAPDPSDPPENFGFKLTEAARDLINIWLDT